MEAKDPSIAEAVLKTLKTNNASETVYGIYSQVGSDYDGTVLDN